MWTWVYRSAQLLLASCVHFSRLEIHLFALHCLCTLSGKDVKVFFLLSQHTPSAVATMKRNERERSHCLLRNKWRISLFMSARSPSLTPSPLLIQIRPSVICQSKNRTSFLAISKEAPSRFQLFFVWQCSAVLSKHTWLSNDNLSSDMSRNLVSQNAVLRERADRVGEVGIDKKRLASTALCYPICIPQACDKVKLSPLGWRASRRHFEVNIPKDAAPFSLKCQTMEAWATWKFTAGRVFNWIGLWAFQ